MVEKTSDSSLPKKVIFKIVQHVADVIEGLLTPTTEKKKKSIFISPKEYRQKMRPFVLNLFIKLEVELSTLVTALAYMDIFNTKTPLKKENIHYVFAVALEVACKYNEDIVFDFESICAILEIETHTMIKLEVEFLEIIDYELFLSKALYDEYNSVLY